MNYKEFYKQAAKYNQIGIYFLFYNNELLYIGETTKLLDRLYTHKCGYKNRIKINFNQFSIINCDKSKLDILEKKYIELLKPKYNVQHQWEKSKITNTAKKNRIKEIAIKKGLYQIDISNAVDVSRVNISYWMNNITQPKQRYVSKLCQVLDITESELFY